MAELNNKRLARNYINNFLVLVHETLHVEGLYSYKGKRFPQKESLLIIPLSMTYRFSEIQFIE